VAKRRSHEGERGQALVEFGLVASVMFLALFAVIDFGRALYAYNLVASSAYIGARYAIVHGSSCTLSMCPASSAAIQTYVRSKVNGINTAQLTVTTTWVKASGCTDPAYQGPLCIAKVQVSYPFQFMIALHQSLTMTMTTQMVISQ
jgi:Flp pilus assembly protein TadG